MNDSKMFVSNLAGTFEKAARIIESLNSLIAFISFKAKKNRDVN